MPQTSSFMLGLACPTEVDDRTDRQREGLVGSVKAIMLQGVYASRVSRLIGIERRVPLRSVNYNCDGYKNKLIIFDPAKSGNKQVERFEYDNSVLYRTMRPREVTGAKMRERQPPHSSLPL